MKKRSLISRTVFMLRIQCILLVSIFFLTFFVSYYTTLDNLQTSSDNLMLLYGREIQNKLDNADMLLEQLIYKNKDYDMLQSEREADRYYASVKIKELIQQQATYNRYVDVVVIAESTYATCLDYANAKIFYDEREALRRFTIERAGEERAKAEWSITQIGAKSYVYKMYVWQGRAAGIFISVSHFMENATENDLKNISILLKDEKEQVWGEFGEELLSYETGNVLDESQIDRWIYETRYPLADGELQMSAYTSMSAFFGQIRWNMVLVLIAFLVFVGFSGSLINFLKKEMITPMSHMQKSMEELQKGDYELRIKEDYKSKEFALLKDTFNRLMDEILGLKIQSYEKQIDLQETELKCVKLQIRPHFFLNAMTTISSLNQQGKNLEIEKYISALSKNIRYMFRSGLHTVSLEEEVQHVRNYFEMQELKYPGCVFYYIDIAPGLGQWKIPQMIIHTIIENEYKYAVNVEQMLTILIKASETELHGEKMLLLEIEDDGKGYPNEVMDAFSCQETMISKNGERVGLQSVKRMIELMYEREGLFAISNIKPHGCKNTFWIPEHAVQEMKEQKQIKLD